MIISSAFADLRYRLVSLSKWIVRLALLCAIVLYLLRTPFDSETQAAAGASGIVFVSSWYIVALLIRRPTPDWKSWVVVHAAIVVVGIVAIAWMPQWSFHIAAIAFFLFAFAPFALDRLAVRRNIAGYERAAALYARLACLLHPSNRFRFHSIFLAARTLGSTADQVAAFRALASRATPEHAAFLKCQISITKGDWEGLLEQLRSTGATARLKSYEIRALGELGRFNEMITTYASAESAVSAIDLAFCRLYVLALCGRPDAVRLLLRGQLSWIRTIHKAHWIFRACQAAGVHDDEARQILVEHAHASDNETFRKRAQTHLDAAPNPGGTVLSAESRAVVTSIEKMLGA